MNLIQGQTQLFFPAFAGAVLKQSNSHREQGRCAVVEFGESCSHQAVSFQDSTELRHYLLATSAKKEPDADHPPRRRLFILEDLPCNHILALGSRLRIPPTFFAGHYDDPTLPTFNHRNPFVRTTDSHFRLRYADSHRAEVDVPQYVKKSLFAYNTNVLRYLHAYDPEGPLYDEPRSHNVLSFWSSTVQENGSWDGRLS